MHKIFVDLNVILDILDAGRPRHALAKEALGQALEREDVLMMSMDMMTIFSIFVIKNLIVIKCKNT